jgi:hypothetical protein
VNTMTMILGSIALLGSMFAIGGCQSGVASGIDPSYQVVEATMLGTWTAANGTKVEIESAGGRAFAVEVEDKTSEAEYRGHLLEIGGKRFAEVSLYQPDRKDAVPVYHYAMVEIAGDVMIHRPLRAEWMAEASRSMPGSIFHSTATEQPGSGGVVVRDRSAMLEMLRKAASDPAALGAAEELKRAR